MACKLPVLQLQEAAAGPCGAAAGRRLSICSHLSNPHRRRARCRAGRWSASSEPQVGVPPPGGSGLGSGGGHPPQGAVQPGPLGSGVSWFTLLVLLGASVSTIAGGFVVFMLYIRPVLKAAERAAAAAEEAAKQMEVAAQEMEKTARVMQEDMPLTFQDMQRTSKEFEILGKQLNYLTGVVVKPVREPVEWVGKAAETTSSTVQSVTSTSIRRVVDDIKTLANSLTPTITQVRDQLAGLYSNSISGSSSEASGSSSPSQLAAGSSRNGSAGGGVAGALLSRASAVATQAEAAAREVNVSRRQADAQRWIANWRSRSRGNRKAVAAAQQQQQQGEEEKEGGSESQRLAQVGQLLADGIVAAEDAAATAAVFAALERAQRAAEEAASASMSLEAAIKKAEDRGALRSLDSSDEDEELPKAKALKGR